MTSTCIGNALRLQLGVDRHSHSKSAQRLDQCLIASSKHILQRSISFERAKQQTSNHMLALKAKYPPINASMAPVTVTNLPNNATSGASSNGCTTPESPECTLPTPEQYMYPAEKINMNWQHRFKACPGLRNHTGTLCYLNSIVNCLIYTPPLANYLMSGEHRKTCHMQGVCLFCLLEEHFAMMRTTAAPQISKLSRCTSHISKTFRGYAQEDAHEALRGILDGMQRSFWHNYHGTIKKSRFAKETTVVNHIFGGFLRSQVKCMKCKGVSNTYDPFMDLSLDIKFNGEVSIQMALQRYVRTEILRLDNAYKCERCKEKVTAEKRFSIHKEPNILTIQLKRFGHTMSSSKWSRMCRYSEQLNLRPYMSENQGSPVTYQLYGVVNHYGYTCQSGHYICYVRSPTDGWVRYNDERRDFVKPFQVLNSSDAYILFYKKVPHPTQSMNTPSPISQHMNTPQKVNLIPQQLIRSQGPQQIPAKTPPSSKIVFHKQNGVKPAVINGLGPLSKPIPLGAQRDKVSFTMSHPPSTPLSHLSQQTNGYSSPGGASSSSDTSSNGKSRLVIKIKDKRKIMYHSVAEAKNSIVPAKALDSEQSTAAKTVKSTPTKLVPYNGVSSSDDEDNHAPKTAKIRRLSTSSPSHNGRKSPDKMKLYVNTNLTLPRSPKRKSPMNSPDKVKSNLLNGNGFKKATPPITPPSSPVKKSKKSPLHQTFQPVINQCLNATVNVPGQAARLDGVKDSPVLPKTNGHSTHVNGNHVSNGDHKYSVVSTSPWRVEPYVSKESPPLVNGHDESLGKHSNRKRRLSDANLKESQRNDKDTMEDDSLYDQALAPITNGHCTTTSTSGETSVEEHSPKKTKKKHKKHKKHKNRSLMASPGGGNTSGDEVVWVERTKETLNSPPQNHAKQTPQKQTPQKMKGDKPTITKYGDKWDGKRKDSDSVIKELQKKDNFGSGENSYWSNPEKAKPAYTSATDNNEFKYKSWHENYEEELDSGKVKKIKNRLSQLPIQPTNAFQAKHDHNKAFGQSQNGFGKGGFHKGGGHGHHRDQHHGGGQQNWKRRQSYGGHDHRGGGDRHNKGGHHQKPYGGGFHKKGRHSFH